ncbi:MAG: beta-lactamase family protein [Rhodospirillales bacterium]|nr:beta-lactamase family protein [Rhodospirillales bacterium]
MIPDYAPLNTWAEGLVASGRLANTELTVFRKGQTEFTCRHGFMDLAGRRPLLDNSIFRIYSMTKPIIAVAIMILAEEQLLCLSDPVSGFIPTFSDQFVSQADGERVAADRQITVHDLMSHTAGLTYGGTEHPPVSTSYRAKGIDFSSAYADLAEMAAKVGTCDRYYQPGTRWIYSVANDILGRIIEVASGLSLDTFISQRILEPLAMADTGWHVKPQDKARFVANFGYDSDGCLRDRSAESEDRYLNGGTLLSGGGGLVSTSSDYMAFARMLLAGGTVDGTRILSPRSLAMMTRNQLPGDLPSMGCPVHSKMDMSGIGYGYGVAVTIDQDKATIGCSNGDFGWGGVANTYFWVDPREDMIVLFMSQLMPAVAMPIRTDLRKLIYQAIR